MPGRLPYTAPKLESLGSLRELTKANQGGQSADSNYGIGTPDAGS